MEETKEKTAHTKGNWQFDRSDMNIYNEIGTAIATVHRRPKVVGVDDIEKSGLSVETIANGNLLQSAPKLLEENKALREALRKINRYAGELLAYGDSRIGRDALAKALTESKPLDSSDTINES